MKKYALLFLMAFAFTSGGCGGSSSSLQADSQDEDTSPKISAPFDSDDDGVPDIFGYYPEGWSNGSKNPADGEAYTVPYLNYIDSSDADTDGTFTVKIHLTQGHEYVVRYSHSGRTLDESYLDFTILTPDEKVLVFDFGFGDDISDDSNPEIQEESSITVSADELSEPPEEDYISEDISHIHEYVTVEASIDILPPENPCIISYTFTAPQTGVYEFSFREMEYSQTSHDLPYELRIYRSDDDSMRELGDLTLTPREMLDLQRVLLSYAAEFNADRLPVSFRPEFVSKDVYTNLIQALAENSVTASGLNAAAEDGAAIKPVVYGVPYDADFKEGAGFYASSGVMALSETAFEKFVMPSPKDGEALPLLVEFKVDEILTEEEHNREQELEAMSTFALCKNALGVRQMTATNVRLGQISKNLVINYDVIEYHPRMSNVNSLQFSSDALELLKKNINEFREEFGDYFVAGYTWGMRFRAVISVSCENRNEMERVCDKIKSMASKARIGADYASEVQDIISLSNRHNVNISIEELTIDGNGAHRNAMSAASSLGTVAGALKSFSERVRTATKNDYVRLKACFRRFREVPAAKSYIPALLPISQSHFNAIVEMNRTIFRTRCSYNALMSIPVTNLMDGSSNQAEWERDFDDLINKTNSELNAICADKSKVENYQWRFQRLHNKYSALCERYLFYRRLMGEQKSQPSGFDNEFVLYGGISGGFKTYPQSSVVMSDYGHYADAFHSDCEHKKEKEFLTYWIWDITGDKSKGNWRYVWFETGWRNTYKSTCRDKEYPTVGSKKIHWHFEGGTWRRAEWYYRNKIIYMSPSDYPFVGLSD